MIYDYQNFDNYAFKQAWEKGFNRKLNEKVYNWAFRSKNKVYVYEDAGQVVGGYCLIPLRIFIDNKLSSGYLCNNVFVHMVAEFKYQRERVFEKLADYCFKKNPSVLIAFPNKNALSSHLNNGWIETLDMAVYEHYKSEYFFCDHVKNIEIEKLPFVSFSELATKVSIDSVNTFSVFKSQEFFKWRYETNPQNLYDYFIVRSEGQVAGYLVVKFFPERKRLHIVDFNFINTKLCNFDKLIALLREVYEHLDYEAIDILESPVFRAKLTASKMFHKSNIFFSMIVKGKQIEGVNFDLAHIVFGDNEVY